MGTRMSQEWRVGGGLGDDPPAGAAVQRVREAQKQQDVVVEERRVANLQRDARDVCQRCNGTRNGVVTPSNDVTA